MPPVQEQIFEVASVNLQEHVSLEELFDVARLIRHEHIQQLDPGSDLVVSVPFGFCWC